MTTKKKPKQEILPWTSSELEKLLLDLIAHGTETAKVDFKSEVEANTPEQKADLLKDIIAIANTYDDNYGDHGFIVYGVKARSVIGLVTTQTDTDKFQNHIEQLLKNYVSPMPQIYLVGFETPTGKSWGAIVIPPRTNKPYMFFKDMQCQDPKRTRTRGEWFVRHGSTTDPGLPEDLAVITYKQTELLLEPLRESVRSLQSRIGKTEEQYNSALFSLVERAISPSPGAAERKAGENEETGAAIGQALGIDLPARLKQKLQSPRDAIADDIIAEAKAIRAFIDGPATELPWVLQINQATENKKAINDLEEKTRQLQRSIAVILLSDRQGAFTEALLRAIGILSKTTQIPSGASYTHNGEALRYYPLGLILYTVFVCGVAANRGDILRQVLEIPLKRHGRNTASHITEIFFIWHQARALFNDATGQRRCEPIAERIRQVINDHIGEMITDCTEAEYFFRGEFVLVLAGIDVDMAKGESADDQAPLPGLYLYLHEASEPIAGLLSENPDWLDKLYAHPLSDILTIFDRNAYKAVAPGCSGAYGFKTAEVHQEALKRKIERK